MCASSFYFLFYCISAHLSCPRHGGTAVGGTLSFILSVTAIFRISYSIWSAFGNCDNSVIRLRACDKKLRRIYQRHFAALPGPTFLTFGRSFDCLWLLPALSQKGRLLLFALVWLIVLAEQYLSTMSPITMTSKLFVLMLVIQILPTICNGVQTLKVYNT